VTNAARTKDDVLDRLREQESRLRSLGVKRLGLFGSFVREEQAPSSDVDVLLEFEPGRKSFDNFMKIAFLLEAVLERHVELVTTEALSPYLGPRILNEVEDVLGGS
jgi:predicted nucleotidyltransferase